VLQIVFALDSALDVVMALSPNEALEPVLLCEPIGHALSVLPQASREIAGHSDVERTIRTVRHDVDPSAWRRFIVGLRPNKSNCLNTRVERRALEPSSSPGSTR